MITLQPNIEVQTTKIEWLWKDVPKGQEDGSIKEIKPEYIVQLQEAYYTWSELAW